MKYNVYLKSLRCQYLILYTVFSLLIGCSQNEELVHTDNKTIEVPIEIQGLPLNQTKSIDTEAHTVNRVLILPFKKIDESILSNDDSNFNLDQVNIKQVEMSSSPSYYTMLSLVAGSTYKVFAIGYNNINYDFDNPTSGRKFELLYLQPNVFSTLYYSALSAADISDIFTGLGSSYRGEEEIGLYFKPENIKTLKFVLARSVSGLNIEIADVPTYVTSITLVAERLVQSIYLTDLTAISTQAESASDILKTFSTQNPVAGAINFNHYLLPTFDANKTKLYLDVRLGSILERYLVKVNNVANVSSANSISFYPNQVVKISGNYSSINLGFTLNYSINLDDDNWDGINLE